MILRAIIRTRLYGTKKQTQVAGYTGPEDLEQARAVVRQQFPYARTILFLIPKETP